LIITTLILKLASRLIDSIKKDAPKPPPVNAGWESLFGAWKNDGPAAEELITLIRNSRLSSSSTSATFFLSLIGLLVA